MTKVKKKIPAWAQLEAVTYCGYEVNEVDAVMDAVQKYKHSVKDRGEKLFKEPVPHPQLTTDGKLDVIILAFLVRKKGWDARKAKAVPARNGQSSMRKATQHSLFRDEVQRRRRSGDS